MEIDLIIENGQIIDLDEGNISQENIYIHKGRIIGLGHSEEFTNTVGKETIDATNKYILPGFWDNHVHFRGGTALIEENKKFLNLFLANGITTVRDTGGDLGKEVLAWRDAINRADMLGPTIFTAGPKIDGPNASWAGSLEVSNKSEVAEALDSLAQLKTDFVKLYDSQITSENFLFAIEESTKRGWISSGHMPFSVNFNEAITSGLNASEHLYYVLKGCSEREMEITQLFKDKSIGFRDALTQIVASYNEEVALKTIALLKKNQTYVVPTLYINHTLSYLDEEDHHNDDYLKFFSPAFIDTYERRIKAAAGASEKSRQDPGPKAIDPPV